MGNELIKDRLKPYEHDIEFCSYCPKLCRFACPAARVTCNEASTPTGKMTLLKLAQDSALEFTSELALVLYQCSGCLISRTYCEHGIEVVGAFEAARAIAVEKGLAPKRVQEFGALWTKHQNPYGQNLAPKLKEPGSGKGSVLVFPGCTMTHYFPQTIRDLCRVLEALGLDYELFSREAFCCGFPLHTTGHRKIFGEYQKQLAGKITGHELILSPCPTCVYFLKTHYLDPGLIQAGAIQHATELIGAKLELLKLNSTVSERIVYHDPCHLGRYLGAYEPPRKILNKISRSGFVEFYENKDRANCCGGGGGLPLAHPQIARAIARARLEEFKQLGGEILASACPMCERMLSRTGKDQGIIVKDLVSLVAQNLD